MNIILIVIFTCRIVCTFYIKVRKVPFFSAKNFVKPADTILQIVPLYNYNLINYDKLWMLTLLSHL